MTSVSQWWPRYNRLKAPITTPAPTKTGRRACTVRLRPIAMHTAMIPNHRRRGQFLVDCGAVHDVESVQGPPLPRDFEVQPGQR
jgi:hypothetical protein